MAKYSLSREARQDIDDILVYIAADDLDAAISFNDRLDDIFFMLVKNPMAGRGRPDLNEGLRCFPLGAYLVFYRIWAGKISITRVLHSARDLDEIFS